MNEFYFVFQNVPANRANIFKSAFFSLLLVLVCFGWQEIPASAIITHKHTTAHNSNTIINKINDVLLSEYIYGIVGILAAVVGIRVAAGIFPSNNYNEINHSLSPMAQQQTLQF